MERMTNQKMQSVAETPLPVPFGNGPLTPFRLLQILNCAADVACSDPVPLSPSAEQAKRQTFDSLLWRMPVSHIPYQRIGAVNNKHQLVDAEYCAYVDENVSGSMHIISLSTGEAKKLEEIGSCLLGTGSVILDTQLRIPYVAMQIHLRSMLMLKVQRLTEEEKKVLGCQTNQAQTVIPPCDVKLALVMPKPAFYWEMVNGKRVLEIRRITKNSYRLDHNIGSLKVSLQTAGISRALPDALFLSSEVLKALNPQTGKTIFRPKPLKRYLGLRRSNAETPSSDTEIRSRRKKADAAS